MRVAWLTAVIAGLTIGAAGQQQPYRVRVDAPHVSLDVFVDDITGKPITTLTREDFTVFEDGQPREITNFSSAETPYNLLLLFDRSSSTQNRWQFLLRAVSRMMEQLGPRDRVALAAFDNKPEMLISWTTPESGSRLRIRTEGEGTDVYRALEWAAKELRNIKGRKGVLVFTDGIDDRLAKDLVRFDANREPRIPTPAEDRDFGKVLETVMQSTSPFYFVAVNTDRNSGPEILTSTFELQMRTQARLRMELVADRSNGDIYFPKSLDEVEELYSKIGRELGNSYAIGFTPGSTEADGKPHRIEVRVRDRGMRVTQSREEYLAR
jgi:Ca-activated chloride channel family protein